MTPAGKIAAGPPRAPSPPPPTSTPQAAPALAPVPAPARDRAAEIARIAALERRIAALETHVSLLPKPAATWQAPTATVFGGLLSAGVAVYGFWRVHRFSVLRQERDEFYKRVQDCVDVVNAAALTASKLWRQSGETAEAEGGVEDLQDAITDIAQRLAFLKNAETTYDVEAVFAEFKRTATLNIEKRDRPANPQIADEARRTGRYLTHAMQTAFFTTFPKTKRGGALRRWFKGNRATPARPPPSG